MVEIKLVKVQGIRCVWNHLMVVGGGRRDDLGEKVLIVQI